MALTRCSHHLRVLGLAAWTTTLSLQWVTSARAQENHGSSEVPSPYRLSIGDDFFPGHNPWLERRFVLINFTLSVSVPFPGLKIAKNVMVCQERAGQVTISECQIFARIKAPMQLTGRIVGTFPLAGDSIKLVACENIAAPKGRRCGDTIATDEKVVPLVAGYRIDLTSITVLHTRAHTTDSAWISWLTETDLSGVSRESCRRLVIDDNNQQAGLECNTKKVGEFQDGPHGATGKEWGAFGGVFPPDSGASLGFAFAVWNYGATTPSLIVESDPLKLSDALVDAALPVLSTMATSEQIDLTPALNDHPWSGCDGPTAGMAFRLTGAQLDKLTRATGSFQQTIGPFVVPSQAGCGASSQYLVTLVVHRNSF